MKGIINKTIVFDPSNLEGAEDFVILVHFSYHAREQGWSEKEIDSIIKEALKGDDKHLFATIKNHCETQEV